MEHALTRANELSADAGNFVVNSWVNSYGRAQRRGTDMGLFYRDFPPVVWRLVQRGDVWVAHSDEHRDLYYGWIAAQPDCLHYVYVKRSFRMAGLAKAMVAKVCPDAEEYSLPITHTWKREKARDCGLDYNPYRVMMIGADDDERDASHRGMVPAADAVQGG